MNYKNKWQLARAGVQINPSILDKLDTQLVGGEVCRCLREGHPASKENWELVAIPAHDS